MGAARSGGRATPPRPPTARTDLADRIRHRLVDGPAARRPGDAAFPGDELGGLVRRETGGIVDDSVIDRLGREVRADLDGAGPLEPLLADPAVSDVLVNAPDSVWVDRGSGPVRVAVAFADEAAVRSLAVRLTVAAGRRLDDAVPFADVVLPDGTRVHAVLPPLVPSTTLSLRVLGRRRFSLADLERAGSVPPPVADVLRDVVRARLATVVTGGTGTGKTTLLAALLGAADPRERIVSIEDARELVVAHPHVVGLVTRAANVEGAGEVGLRDLVRQALRMRPDRVVVGELRGAEMLDLLVALNTGHEGGAATLHANSASDVPARLAALGALAGLDLPAVTSLAASALDVIVQLRRDRAGRRGVAEVAVLARSADRLLVEPVWTAGSAGSGGVGPGLDGLCRLLEARLPGSSGSARALGRGP